MFVGNGTPAMAADFARRHAAGCAVLTDPSLASYEALGLRRSVAATFGPGSVIQGVKAAFGGHVQTGLAGDAWQQGGVFVLGRGGEVLYEQRNEHAGTRPDVAAILQALARAAEPTTKRTA